MAKLPARVNHLVRPIPEPFCAIGKPLRVLENALKAVVAVIGIPVIPSKDEIFGQNRIRAHQSAEGVHRIPWVTSLFELDNLRQDKFSSAKKSIPTTAANIHRQCSR